MYNNYSEHTDIFIVPIAYHIECFTTIVWSFLDGYFNLLAASSRSLRVLIGSHEDAGITREDNRL